eukprot:2058279-Pleurochrysis_carterae.AAC.3
MMSFQLSTNTVTNSIVAEECSNGKPVGRRDLVRLLQLLDGGGHARRRRPLLQLQAAELRAADKAQRNSTANKCSRRQTIEFRQKGPRAAMGTR